MLWFSVIFNFVFWCCFLLTLWNNRVWNSDFFLSIWWFLRFLCIGWWLIFKLIFRTSSHILLSSCYFICISSFFATDFISTWFSILLCFQSFNCFKGIILRGQIIIFTWTWSSCITCSSSGWRRRWCFCGRCSWIRCWGWIGGVWGTWFIFRSCVVGDLLLFNFHLLFFGFRNLCRRLLLLFACCNTTPKPCENIINNKKLRLFINFIKCWCINCGTSTGLG